MMAVNIIEEMKLTRCEILKRIREELGNSEETEILIDYIQDLWETVDLLKKKFSQERALEIINTPSACNFAPDEYPHT